MWHCRQVKEKNVYNFPVSWPVFRSISPALHSKIHSLHSLLPGNDCSKMKLKGWPSSCYFKWRIWKQSLHLSFFSCIRDENTKLATKGSWEITDLCFCIFPEWNGFSWKIQIFCVLGFYSSQPDSWQHDSQWNGRNRWWSRVFILDLLLLVAVPALDENSHWYLCEKSHFSELYLMIYGILRRCWSLLPHVQGCFIPLHRDCSGENTHQGKKLSLQRIKLELTACESCLSLWCCHP